MKIAICLYPINNLGGIINHTEHLAAGLMELGHDVNILQMMYKEKVRDQKMGPAGFSPSVIGRGVKVSQKQGWQFPSSNLIAYKGSYCQRIAVSRLNQYDMIIWTIPCPTKTAENEGNLDWLALYNLDPKVKQIAVVHDGNLKQACPHILEISKYLSGIACVHPCGYNGADFVPLPRAMILNPQKPQRNILPTWEQRKKGFVNMQTFKAWKHAHELVEAIAYMPPKQEDEHRMVAGEGIEYHYMASQGKCKEHYYHADGRKFWSVALENGMQRPPNNYLSETEADDLLHTARVLVDPSWSKKYAQNGDHFNRVVVDAIRCGAIPIARPLGISDNEQGVGVVFKPNENYVMIPQETTPQQYADIILGLGQSTDAETKHLREGGQDLLRHFDRKLVAQQYIDLAEGKETGFFNRLEVGTKTSDLVAASEKIMSNFFSNKGA